jgi:hypothetical protein
MFTVQLDCCLELSEINPSLFSEYNTRNLQIIEENGPAGGCAVIQITFFDYNELCDYLISVGYSDEESVHDDYLELYKV